MSLLQQAMGIGIAVPISLALLYGFGDGKKVKMREYAMVGLAAMASSTVVLSMVPSNGAMVMPTAVRAPCPTTGKSVSDVTVQLGRYSEGVKYPGQIRGVAGPSAQYTDGSVIFVD